MKLIARIAAILAAAAVIIAITYAIGQTSLAQNLMPSGPDRSAIGQNASASSASVATGTGSANPDSNMQAPPAGRPERGEGAGGGMRSALEIGKNLAVVAIVTMLVSLVKRFLPKRGSKNGGKKAHPAAAPPSIA